MNGMFSFKSLVSLICGVSGDYHSLDERTGRSSRPEPEAGGAPKTNKRSYTGRGEEGEAECETRYTR